MNLLADNNLYSQFLPLSTELMTEEIQNLSLPFLEQEDVEALDAQISTLEIEASI